MSARFQPDTPSLGENCPRLGKAYLPIAARGICWWRGGRPIRVALRSCIGRCIGRPLPRAVLGARPRSHAVGRGTVHTGSATAACARTLIARGLGREAVLLGGCSRAGTADIHSRGGCVCLPLSKLLTVEVGRLLALCGRGLAGVVRRPVVDAMMDRGSAWGRHRCGEDQRRNAADYHLLLHGDLLILPYGGTS